jgi:ribosome biogenesis protein BRX1
MSSIYIHRSYFNDSLYHQIRALEKRKKAGKYAHKVKAKVRRREHEKVHHLEPDEFADIWKGED